MPRTGTDVVVEVSDERASEARAVLRDQAGADPGWSPLAGPADRGPDPTTR